MHKRPYLFLFLFLSILGLQAQVPQERTDLRLQDVSIPEALEALEARTGIAVYFQQDWFSDAKISREYEGQTPEFILGDLLQGTEVNLFRYGPKTFVLTRNNLIYDQLPEGFFGPGADSVMAVGEQGRPSTTLPVTPVFVSQQALSTSREVETIRIGKQNLSDPRESFILSGYVRERGSNRPLADLVILERNRGLGTATDANGYYELRLPAGLNLLETRSVGKQAERKQVILYNDGQLDWLVEEGVEQLEEVVVEARQDRNVEEVVSGTQVINAEESKDIPLVLGERNILDVAASLPGISRAGEGALGLNVRGGRTDQNMFLLNEAIVYNPTHFFGIFQALNPFVTEQVEIFKGVIPVEYGGRLSSVFDIQTKDGSTEGLKGEGSVGPVTANLALEIPVRSDKSSLVIGGRVAYSDWILRALDDEDLSNSTASFYDLIGTYTDRLNENNRIKATGYYSKDRFSITSDSTFRYSNRAASVVWDHRFNERNNASFSLANSRYAFDVGYDADSNTDFELGYSVEETEFKGFNRFRINERHRLTYGLSGKYYRVNPGTLEPLGSDSDVAFQEIAREQGLEGGIFVSDDWEATDKLSLSAGVRLSLFTALGPSDQTVYAPGQPRNPTTAIDTLSYGSGESIKTYGGPEVRFSARYLLDPSLSVKAGFSNMYQYIHTLTNTTTVSPLDTWKLSDFNIRPQTSQQVTLGFFKNLEDGLEASVEGYYKWSQDVLDFKTGAQILLNESIETEVIQGDGKAYGVEFLLKKTQGKLNGWLGYTYSRSLIRFDSPFPEERVNNGEFFPSNYDRPHDISLIANYKFTQRYSASLNFSYQTGRPVTYPIGQFNFNNADYVFYSDRNAQRIPDYIRLDLGINIEGNHRKNKLAHSFWTISVYNVLGRNNPYSLFFVTDNGEVKALQSSIFAIPIPSVTYNFKF
ncbi:MAG: carboxypeptidase-like regulatory domain-containing protein [Robiginitalea sp.]|nr:carboxypeptidase-like regulatory domain-containing protein [Robiginitalea sp.]